MLKTLERRFRFGKCTTVVYNRANMGKSPHLRFALKREGEIFCLARNKSTKPSSYVGWVVNAREANLLSRVCIARQVRAGGTSRHVATMQSKVRLQDSKARLRRAEGGTYKSSALCYRRDATAMCSRCCASRARPRARVVRFRHAGIGAVALLEARDDKNLTGCIPY
jgi:hypothetical protein